MQWFSMMLDSLNSDTRQRLQLKSSIDSMYLHEAIHQLCTLICNDWQQLYTSNLQRFDYAHSAASNSTSLVCADSHLTGFRLYHA